MSIKFRPATIKEAADSVLRCVLIESRRNQINWFKEHYGEQFGKQVEALVKQKWKGKKNG